MSAPRLATKPSRPDPRHEFARRLPVDLCRKILRVLDAHAGHSGRGREVGIKLALDDEHGHVLARKSAIQPPWEHPDPDPDDPTPRTLLTTDHDTV